MSRIDRKKEEYVQRIEIQKPLDICEIRIGSVFREGIGQEHKGRCAW